MDRTKKSNVEGSEGFFSLFGHFKPTVNSQLITDAIKASSGRDEPYAEHIVELLEKKGLAPIIRVTKKMNKLADDNTDLNNSLENLRKRHEIIQEENEKLRATQSSLERKLETSSMKVWRLENELESIKAENSKCQNQLKTMETSLHKLQRENVEFQKNRWSEHEVSQLKCIHQDEMKKFQKQLQDLETLIDQLQSENTTKTENLTKLQEKLSSLTTQHDNCTQLKQAALAFSEKVYQKEAKLPDRGTNNTEDVEMEKFVEFVLLDAEKLGKLAEENF